MKLNDDQKKIVDHLAKYQNDEDPIKINISIYREYEKIYEKLHENSSRIMKIVSHEKNEKKNWELIFCPWLRYFLVSIIYKKNFYEYLVKKREDLSFLNINSIKDINIFSDHNSFMFNTNNLDWNLNCLKIIHFSKKIKDKKNYSLKDNFKLIVEIKKTKKNFRQLFKIFISNLFYKIFLKKKYTYFSFPTRFSYIDKFKLFLKTNKGVYFEEENIIFNDENYKFEPDLNIRDRVYRSLLEIENLDFSITILMSIFITLSKLENYYFFKSQINKNLIKRKNFDVVFTQGSHIDNEIKLHEFYDFYIKNKTINVVQHGNNYDLIEKKYHTGIDHEYIFEKDLFTWGWSNNINEKKITSPRLINSKKKFLNIKNKNVKNKILYVMGPSLEWNFPRSLHQTHNFSKISEKLRSNFFNCFNSEQKKKILFRKYPYQSYHGMKGFDFDLDIDVNNISKKNNFYLEAKETFVIIFDHISTANLECTTINKPFFLLFKSESYFLSDKAKKIFKELEQKEIFHQSHLSIYDLLLKVDKWNILEWWNDKNRKELIETFINEYAFYSKDPIKEWSDLINAKNKF